VQAIVVADTDDRTAILVSHQPLNKNTDRSFGSKYPPSSRGNIEIDLSRYWLLKQP